LPSDYSHMVWVEALVIDLYAHKDDDEKKSEILVDAIDYFKALTPADKADVMLYILGRIVEPN
jgi:hypothetical protein